jgi:hypothetical protein
VPRRPVGDLLESRGKRFTDLAADPQAARGQVSELVGAADALVVTPAAVMATGFTDPAELAREHPHLVIAVLTAFRPDRRAARAGWAPRRPPRRSVAPCPAPVSRVASRAPAGRGVPARRPPRDRLGRPGRGAPFRDPLRAPRCGPGLLGLRGWSGLPGPAYGITGSGTPDTVDAYGRPDAADVYPIFRVWEGYVRLCPLAKGQWLAMRAWMDEPEPPMGDDLLTNPGRWANADLVVPSRTSLPR